MRRTVVFTQFCIILIATTLCYGCSPGPFPVISQEPSLPQPDDESSAIVNDIVAVEDDGYLEFSFNVDTRNMRNVRVVGWFMASGGSRNDIEVLVLDEMDFINWDNLHELEGLYKSGRITIAQLDVPIRVSGNYHLVFNNRFSGFSHKKVKAEFYLYWVD